jgi:hypothetical protein
MICNITHWILADIIRSFPNYNGETQLEGDCVCLDFGSFGANK